MKFHEMTWPLLREVRREEVVVVAPIAACEQHSRHLPVFTDTILVTGVAEGVEKRLPSKVLLLPTLWFGASHHHLAFFGRDIHREGGPAGIQPDKKVFFFHSFTR